MNNIPQCINIGCTRNVQIRHRTTQGTPNFKCLCSRCYRASHNMGHALESMLADGVIPIKKSYCENSRRQILEFKCTGNYESEWKGCQLDLDHIDGNHFNSNPENIQTICRNCHSRKSVESNDCNSYKKSTQRILLEK